jgi:hypothetical protein
MNMRHTTILLAILALGPSCGRGASSRDDFHVDITVNSKGGGDQSSKNAQDQDGGQKPRSPKLPPREGETLLGLFAINIDADIEEEQVCALKRRDDSSSFIRVAILDQKSSSGNWQRIWDGATLATKFPTFNLSVKDMLGTHSQDIVCTGMNDSGRQTLTVFHPTGSGDEYATLLGLEADSMEIRETERPESYALGQSDGDPWNVLSYEQNPDSSNYLDQLETAWTWNPRKKAYEKGTVQAISGSNIEQKIIERYLNHDAPTFEKFLSGIWYLNQGSAKSPGAGKIIQFDPESKTIAFSENDDMVSLSVFAWNDSQATKLGLFVSTQNTAVDSMKRFLDVELRGPDTISVRVIEDLYMRSDPISQWNGTYRKMSSENGDSPAEPQPKALSGRFVSANGVEMVFTPPRFLWKGSGPEQQGVFSQYALGDSMVIVLKSMKASGVIIKSWTFKLERKEKKGSAAGGETITLSPARTTTNGLDLFDQDAIVLDLVP